MNTRLLLPLIVCGLLSACDPPAADPPPLPAAPRKPLVLAENYPLAYFAERIGGAEVEVVVADITGAGFQQAAACLLYNSSVPGVSDHAKAVDTAAAFRSKLPSGDPAEAATWLDFSQAMKQTEAVTDAMFRLVPGQAEFLALNHDLLLKELMELDARMTAVGRRLTGQPMQASSGIYQHLARRYQLNISVVNLDEPATHAGKWIILEREPSDDVKAKLEAAGLRSVVFDPCLIPPEYRSWKMVMESNVTAMEKMAGL